jgi:anti-sigma B factor antagonist
VPAPKGSAPLQGQLLLDQSITLQSRCHRDPRYIRNVPVHESVVVRMSERAEHGIDICAFKGDIDLHYNQALRAILRGKHNARCPALVLDLSGVEFIDSRGLAAIFEYVRDAAEHGGIIALAALSESIRPIIETVQFQRVAPVYETVEDAVTALRGKTPQVESRSSQT